MDASEPLLRFVAAARGAGVRVSPAESIDAMRAVALVGYTDRLMLRDALCLTLAKTPQEKAALESCFDAYFARGRAQEETAVPEAAIAQEGAFGSGSGDGLGRMLLENDDAAIATAIEEAAEAVGLVNIRFVTQRNLYARRVLDRMGLTALESEILALRRQEAPKSLSAARQLEAALAALRAQVRNFVERQLLLFARGETEELREELLKSARLSNVDRRDYERLHTLVHAMARRLATRYARPRRRRLRGQLDVRLTLRRNMGWGGIPFVTVWKERRIERPRVVALCDVSGSVAAYARFLLMFLYAMNEALADIRSFAFAGSMVDVSEILESLPIEQAIGRIMTIVGFGSSNYGNALTDFETGWMQILNPRTTVIVLGDARGNRTEPRSDILQRIAARSRRVIWLNPEYRAGWGTGDSDMFRYAPYCQIVRTCGTLRELERAIEEMLEGR